MKIYDVIIIGGGAAGLFAATQLYIRNKSTLIIDMGDVPGRKIAVSGGGKCNFTNTDANYKRYFGQNPEFVRSALSQFTPFDTLKWVKSHNIKYIEKEPGRFFCQNSANDIIDALLRDIGNIKISTNTTVNDVVKKDELFTIKTNLGEFYAHKIIVATGGLSWAHLGVSGIGYTIAKKFGHKSEPVRPGLCGIKTNSFSDRLAGISLPVEIKIGKNIISDDLLFTHFGIGGPAAYRASLFGEKQMIINFAPNIKVFEFLKSKKQTNGKKTIANVLSEFLPNKFAHFICDDTRNIADFKDSELTKIATRTNQFEINDAHTTGLQSAEITVGGVSVAEISSKTMESKLCDGLYFAGEVMDIAGDLGGFNLQWAFASGYVAGNNA